MSRRGAARMVNVDHKAVTYWKRRIDDADRVGNKTLPECFKPLVGKCLTVGNNEEVLGVPFCSAIINYYACYASPEDQTPEAKFALMVCTSIGLEKHIQEKTGWNQPQQLELPIDVELRKLELQAQIENAQARKAAIELEKMKLMIEQSKPVKTSPVIVFTSENKKQKEPKTLEQSYQEIAEFAVRKGLTAVDNRHVQRRRMTEKAAEAKELLKQLALNGFGETTKSARGLVIFRPIAGW